MANEMSTTGENETFYFSLCGGDGAQNSRRITSQYRNVPRGGYKPRDDPQDEQGTRHLTVACTLDKC